jgi:molybdenum cofactor biosynthesis enzyme MoaA
VTLGSLTSALGFLREPVPAEKRAILRRRWDALAPGVRGRTQGLGRQSTGCGATVGAHPRCDFACTSCYLGTDANLATPLGVDEVCRQLDRLRLPLGPKGNVQITDGEVTLLPRPDLIAILRHARQIGLIPMLMTHGDSFRTDASLLPALVRDGGLMEVAIVEVDVERVSRRTAIARSSATRRTTGALTRASPHSFGSGGRRG